MYLLDTPVVLHLRNARTAKATDEGVVAWAEGVSRHSLFISAVTLLELQDAAAAVERTDRSTGTAQKTWIGDQVVPAFKDRILPVDSDVVRRQGGLGYADARDGLLAATALQHGLTLATPRPSAFRLGKVKLLNPWQYKPETAEDDADWGQAGRTGALWLKNLFVRS